MRSRYLLEASSLVNGSSSGMYGESAQGLCLVMWQTLPVSSFKILMQSGVDVRRVTSRFTHLQKKVIEGDTMTRVILVSNLGHTD